MTRFHWTGALGAAVLLLAPASAFAHATLAVAEAAPNSTYRGVVRVPHGCDRAATTGVAVQIPEGVISVKPMPKAGWTLQTRRAPYPRSYLYYGSELTEGVSEITWSGGRLEDEFYEEFVFIAYLSDAIKPGATLRFPIVQTCDKAEVRWVEIPAEGQDAHSLKRPAPAVRVVAAGTAPKAEAAAGFRAGAILVEAPWSRATPGGAKVAGGYMRITNTGTEPDRLVGGSAEIARRFEVHSMEMSGGVARMAPVEGGLVIKPGETVELKPGGYHAMLMDLTAAPKEGDVVRGTLVFERAGTLAISYRVGGLGAQSGPEEQHRH